MGIFDKIKKIVGFEMWKRKKKDKTTWDMEIPLTFKVGSVGEILGESFEDIGQVRYEWGGGMWDECLLEMKDGKKKWLLIDEPTFIMFDEESFIPVGNINNGWNLINNKKFFIESKRKATVTNTAGYSEVKVGTDVNCYDGYDEGKNFISVREYLGKYKRNTVLRTGRKINKFEIEVYG